MGVLRARQQLPSFSRERGHSLAGADRKTDGTSMDGEERAWDAERSRRGHGEVRSAE